MDYRFSTFMTMSYGRHGEGFKNNYNYYNYPGRGGRGGREISNPAKTTTALRDGS